VDLEHPRLRRGQQGIQPIAMQLGAGDRLIGELKLRLEMVSIASRQVAALALLVGNALVPL
jgi:hypothetical protein